MQPTRCLNRVIEFVPVFGALKRIAELDAFIFTIHACVHMCVLHSHRHKIRNKGPESKDPGGKNERAIPAALLSKVNNRRGDRRRS